MEKLICFDHSWCWRVSCNIILLSISCLMYIHAFLMTLLQIPAPPGIRRKLLEYIIKCLPMRWKTPCKFSSFHLLLENSWFFILKLKKKNENAASHFHKHLISQVPEKHIDFKDKTSTPGTFLTVALDPGVLLFVLENCQNSV